MPHSAAQPSTFYFWLVINTLLASSFGIILPLLLLQEARRLRYMQGIRAQLFVRLTAVTLILLGIAFSLDVINEHFWSIQTLHMFVWLFAAVFFITFTIVCWSNRQALASLYPQEDFVLEQQKRKRLLAKLEQCDRVMPLPRFESKNGVITYANQAAQQLLQYSLQEMHHMAPAALVHEDDREKVLQQLLSRDVGCYECRVITATGRVVFVEVRSTHDPSDADIRITFLTDVTNYVEQRDRFIRDIKLHRSTEARRVAEEGLLNAIGQPEGLAQVG